MQVEIWSDVVCPWCYLGKRRFEQALAAFAHGDEIEIVYRSFELDPNAPRGVTVPAVEMLAGKYGMTPAQAQQAHREMEQRAAGDGLEFHMDALLSGNTRDAHRLLHLAKESGRQADLAEALHRAHFTEQRSIFEPTELAAIAVATGLDAERVAAVLAGSEFTDAVEEDEATARALGATGVPFFVLDRRYGVSGAQPADVLRSALEQAWSDRAA